MSQVSIVHGKLGQGKTYACTYLMWEEFRRRDGRRQYSTFPTKFSRPLMTISHAWCPEFSGSDMTYDEMASDFNARDTRDVDRLAADAIRHARHQDVRLRLIAQHSAMLDVSLRRLCDAFIQVRRTGAAGERAARRKRAAMDAKRDCVILPWQRPLYFTLRFYKDTDFTQEWDLKDEARPFRKRRIPFRWDVAFGYDSHNMIIPDASAEQWAALQKGAAVCAGLPRYTFVNGRHVKTVRPPDEVVFPVPAIRVAKRDKEADADQARAFIARKLEQMGYVDATAGMVGDVVPAWPQLGSPDEVVQLRGKVTWWRELDGIPGCIEVVIDGDQAVVVPRVALDGLDPDRLIGARFECSLDVHRSPDGTAVSVLSLSEPIRLRKVG